MKAISLSDTIFKIQRSHSFTLLKKYLKIVKANEFLSKKFDHKLIQKYFVGWNKEEYEDTFGIILTYSNAGNNIQTSGGDYSIYKDNKPPNERISCTFTTINSFIEDCKRAKIELQYTKIAKKELFA